jgi:hypothetical protein
MVRPRATSGRQAPEWNPRAAISSPGRDPGDATNVLSAVSRSRCPVRITWAAPTPAIASGGERRR